ncbi:MAG: Rpn family recombination-promoting nuclease/putative transposase [Bacteroidia bacterium]
MKRKHNRTSVPRGPVSNPHDRFFKHTLKDSEKILGTLEGILPADLFARLVPETLSPADTSYIDPELQEFFSDLVFTCLTREGVPVHLSFLFEHKSYPVDFPHIQILRYMLEIWDRQVREKQPLSVVVPIVVYHGKDAWKYRDFSSYFSGDLSGLSGYLPNFDFEMLNLQAASFEEIGRQFPLPALKIAFRLMKAIRDEDISEKVKAIFGDLGELKKVQGGGIIFRTFFVYLLQGSKADVNAIMKNMYNLIPEEWVEMYEDSPAMQLIRRGREEMRQEVESKIAEAMRQEANALKKEFEARQRAENEAKEKAEARRKEAEALQRLESEKIATLVRMLDAGIKKADIAIFLGISRQKLAAYIRKINKESRNAFEN